MKKGTGVLLIVSALVLVFLIVIVKSYRSLSTLNEEVKNKEADINVQLKRKKDQVGKLIEISRKYVKDEDTLFTELELQNNSLEAIDIYIAREKAGINERIIERLNEVFSKYDNNTLQDEELRLVINDLLSTEKRIAIAAKNFNTAVSEYNSKINGFPSSIIAFFRGYKRMDEFTISVELNNIFKDE